MRKSVVVAGALLLASCWTATELSSPDIEQVLNPDQPGARTEALKRLRGLLPGQFGCGVLDQIAGAATVFEEADARLALEALGPVPCPNVIAALEAAARGHWRARTGITRAYAITALEAGENAGARQVGTAIPLASSLVADDSDLVRARAFRYGIEHSSAARDRAVLLGRAQGDTSRVVRIVAGGDE